MCRFNSDVLLYCGALTALCSLPNGSWTQAWLEGLWKSMLVRKCYSLILFCTWRWGLIFKVKRSCSVHDSQRELDDRNTLLLSAPKLSYLHHLCFKKSDPRLFRPVLFRLTLQKTKIDSRAMSAFHKAILVFLSLNPETHSLLSLPAPSLSAQDPHY